MVFWRIYIIAAFLFCSSPGWAADSVRIQTILEQGVQSMDQGRFDSAASLFGQAADLSRQTGNRFYEAIVLYHQSRLHELRHHLLPALDALHEAVVIFEELGRQKNVANSYNSYNRIYQTLGNYPQALEYGLRALRIKETLQDQPGISTALTNVGNVHLLTGRYNDALVCFRRALTIDSVNNDPEGISISLLNIGVVHHKKKNYAEALDYYYRSLIITRELGNRADEAWLLGNIGAVLRQTGKLDSSLVILFGALRLLEEVKEGQAHTLNDIAETYRELQKSTDAKKYSQLAIEAAQEEQNLNQLRYGYENLAGSYERLGDYRRAYEALQQHSRYKDSLVNIEKEKQLDELEIRYRSEKQEQTIVSLREQQAVSLFRRNTYLIIGILTTVILLLLYNYQRISSRKNRQMYEEERELERMKSAFFSNISHEFRTPLTLILGPTQLLRAGTTDPEVAGQLATVEKNAERLLKLIDQILDLSKLESGRLTVSPSMFDIVTMIKGITMTFSSLATVKQIKLQAQSTVASLLVKADKEKMETVLINLLSNAFKFTPGNGSITVSLDLVRKKANTTYCRISVEDSGIGIAEKDLPHVFERFYQGDGGQRTEYAGSGIGLALARELVELHGGYMTASSEHQGGTRMSFLLPVEEDFAVNPVNSETKLAANGELTGEVVLQRPATTCSERKETSPLVLLIEDNEDVTRYLKDILQHDYTVVEARDGAAGIATAIETIPDLIISDVMMPLKNGYEVCEALKQEEKTSHIPFILLTAKASMEDKLQGLQYKADEYLTKPFSPRELLLRVANLIQSRAALQEKYSRRLVLEPPGVTASSMEEVFLQKLMRVVEEKLADEDFSVAQLAREMGMSRSQLHRKLQALTNQSATEFIRAYRLTRAMDMIRQRAGSISEIAYWVGFSSPSYFGRVFQRHFGMTPGQAGADPSNLAN